MTTVAIMAFMVSLRRPPVFAVVAIKAVLGLGSNGASWIAREPTFVNLPVNHGHAVASCANCGKLHSCQGIIARK
jgi:hypothetical protein